jgi:hypothetical protein
MQARCGIMRVPMLLFRALDQIERRCQLRRQATDDDKKLPLVLRPFPTFTHELLSQMA